MFYNFCTSCGHNMMHSNNKLSNSNFFFYKKPFNLFRFWNIYTIIFVKKMSWNSVQNYKTTVHTFTYYSQYYRRCFEEICRTMGCDCMFVKNTQKHWKWQYGRYFTSFHGNFRLHECSCNCFYRILTYK